MYLNSTEVRIRECYIGAGPLLVVKKIRNFSWNKFGYYFPLQVIVLHSTNI